MPNRNHYDFVIVGSGFGGSVSALRLSEKGYKVLILEKGQRLTAEDFPESNWNLKRWLWFPSLNWRGLFNISLFRHLTVFSGVGVGGGSLVYGNTLPIPNEKFFKAPSWSALADWQQELKAHYQTARRMLGATENQYSTFTDEALNEVAHDIGREKSFHPTCISVYMGKPGLTVPDPYFNGHGPDRTGCIYCGGCMIGCRFNSKNTLDKNYLYLAEKFGCTIQADTQVVEIAPQKANAGYVLKAVKSEGWLKRHHKTITADKVILSGGVLGTVPLLLKLQSKKNCLPNLSRTLGRFIRTNNEALIGVVSPDSKQDFSKGVAISSIICTDDHSHMEPVRYSKGSGFLRTLIYPHSPGNNVWHRLLYGLKEIIKSPKLWLKVLFVKDFAVKSQILLYMRSLEATLSLKRTTGLVRLLGIKTATELDDGQAPQAFIPEATSLAKKFAEKVNGTLVSLITESIMGIPSTAHILGGCCMGKSVDSGVINSRHEVYNYPGLYVIDGSAVSANPGVNPSLTITALAERAMSFIPENRRTTSEHDRFAKSSNPKYETEDTNFY